VTVFIMTLVTIAVDVNWMISDYFPQRLDSIQDEMAFTVEQGEYVIREFAWYIIMIGIAFKIIPLFILIRISGNGRQLLHQLWKKTFVFFPPMSSHERDGVDLEGRVVAIIWLEALCALFTISLTIYVQMRLSWSPVFTTASPFTPLINIMYAKGITAILYVLGILHNANLFAVISEFGCMQSCYKQRLDSNGERLPRVFIDISFIKFNGFLKSVDLVVSVLLWISIVMSRGLGGLDQPKEVRVALGGIIILLSISSLYSYMLALIVLW
jgi:hypothetical protein